MTDLVDSHDGNQFNLYKISSSTNKRRMSGRGDDSGLLPILGGIAVGAGLLALFYKMFLSGGPKKQRCITGGPATWDSPPRKPTKCEQQKREKEE